MLNFLIKDLGKFRTGHGDTTREPIRIRGTGDGWNLPLTEDEVRKRLTELDDEQSKPPKGEESPGSKFKTSCLRDGTWIVDVPGFQEFGGDCPKSRRVKYFMKEADLILFVAAAEGEYKRGKAGRILGDEGRERLVFLTKADRLTKEKTEKSKAVFKDWLKEEKIELPEENRFLFASCMDDREDSAKLEKLSQRGILKQMEDGLGKLWKKLDELPYVHLERKLRELKDEDADFRKKYPTRARCFWDFLEREIKPRENKREILLKEIRPLEVLENSESYWKDETDEIIKKASRRQRFEMNETAHRLSALRHSVRDASRTWKFWTKKFWRRNEWFAKELESSFEHELEKLIESVKTTLFHSVSTKSQIIADSLKKHAAALGTEAMSEWHRAIISQRDEFLGNLDQSLPSLRLSRKQDKTDRKASFPDSICRNFRSGLAQDCLRPVSLLKVDEEEQFDEIMVCFGKLADAFKKEMKKGIRKEAFAGARHLGHEMRIEATRRLEKPRHSQEKVCRDLKRFEDAREKISSP